MRKSFIEKSSLYESSGHHQHSIQNAIFTSCTDSWVNLLPQSDHTTEKTTVDVPPPIIVGYRVHFTGIITGIIKLVKEILTETLTKVRQTLKKS